MNTSQSRLTNLNSYFAFVDVATVDNSGVTNNGVYTPGPGIVRTVLEVAPNGDAIDGYTFTYDVFDTTGKRVNCDKPYKTDKVSATKMLVDAANCLAYLHPEVEIIRLGFNSEAKEQNSFADFIKKHS